MDIKNIVQHYDELLAAGETGEAGLYLEKMSAQAEKERDIAAVVTLSTELEGYWRAAGNKRKCYEAAEKALLLLEACELTESAEFATALLNYATAKAAFGEAQEAFEVFSRLEQLYAELIPADDYRFACLYNNMAQSLLRLGRAKEARDFFAKSFSLLEKAEDSADEKATCRANIAVCLMAEGKLAEARAALEEAKAFFGEGKNAPHYDTMLASFGQLEYLEKNYEAAAEYYRLAATGVERRFGHNGSYRALCRNRAKALEAAGLSSEAALCRGLAEESQERAQ